MVTISFCWTVIVGFSKWICASVRKEAHTPAEKKTIKPLHWAIKKHSASWKLYNKHYEANFQEITQQYLVPVSQKHAPTQTSCHSCPLTSPPPCSGPETRRPAAWCQTEWVSQGLSGPLVPEQPLSSGNRRWQHIRLLASLCKNETDRMKMNYKE